MSGCVSGGSESGGSLSCEGACEMTIQSSTGNLQIKYTVGRIFRSHGRVYAPTDGIHPSSVPPTRAGASLRPAPAPRLPCRNGKKRMARYQIFWRLKMKLESLRDLYVEQLKDPYNAEQHMITALPKMAKAAESEELKAAFEDHLGQTRQHAQRIATIFEQMVE